jgi:hypothetical protein
MGPETAVSAIAVMPFALAPSVMRAGWSWSGIIVDGPERGLWRTGAALAEPFAERPARTWARGDVSISHMDEDRRRMMADDMGRVIQGWSAASAGGGIVETVAGNHPSTAGTSARTTLGQFVLIIAGTMG